MRNILMTMWNESSFVDPQQSFETSDNWLTLWNRLLHPIESRFYLSPSGYYYVSNFLYLMYLAIITATTVFPIYPYSYLKPFEVVIWITAAQFVVYELTEMFMKGKRQYFARKSGINHIDIIMSINWILLFFVRFNVLLGFNFVIADDYYTYNSEGECQHEVEGTINCNNGTYTVIYMILWTLQLIFGWIRVIALYRMGPLLRMIASMVVEIYNILVIMIMLFFGYMFAIHFFTLDVPKEHQLYTLRGTAMFCFQMLIGQHEWTILSDEGENDFSVFRSWYATTLAVSFVFIGTILVFNVLLAIMLTKFDEMSKNTDAEYLFVQAELSYDILQQGYSMPAPFNLLTAIVWLILLIISKFICCKKTFQRSRSKSSFGQHTFNRLAIEHDLKDIKDIDTENHNGNKVYCRCCHYGMYYVYHSLDDFFNHDSFKDEHSNDNLDEHDRKIIESAIGQYCALCPECFLPYKIWHKQSAAVSSDKDMSLRTDRYTFFWVLMEKSSNYVFLTFLWIPLLLLVSIPAGLLKLRSGISNHLNKKMEKKNKKIKTVAFTSFHKSLQQQHARDFIYNEQDEEEDENYQIKKRLDDMVQKINDENYQIIKTVKNTMSNITQIESNEQIASQTQNLGKNVTDSDITENDSDDEDEQLVE